MTRVDPSAKRRISAPSRSSPANVPLTDSSAAAWTVRGVPSGWARSTQERKTESGPVRHAAIARLTAAARRGANASGVTMETGARLAAGRSMSGAQARLTPKPATVRSPDRSIRIPASLDVPSSRSFGHLSISPASGAAAATASNRAIPQLSDSRGADFCSGPATISVLPWKFPARDCHCRPCLPRPPDCVRAISQSPSPAARSLRRASLVDATLSTNRNRLRGRCSPRCCSAMRSDRSAHSQTVTRTARQARSRPFRASSADAQAALPERRST